MKSEQNNFGWACCVDTVPLTAFRSHDKTNAIRVGKSFAKSWFALG